MKQLPGKIYPVTRTEKLFAGALPALALAGFFGFKAPAPPTPDPTRTDDVRFCMSVGFIINYQKCWIIYKPKELTPDTPVTPTCQEGIISVPCDHSA